MYFAIKPKKLIQLIRLTGLITAFSAGSAFAANNTSETNSTTNLTPNDSNPDFSSLFKNQNACFVLYDLTQRKLINIYNKSLCKTEYSPNSTFKIALSLMAFDSQVISQNTVFKWSGEHYNFSNWNQDQTPKTWLDYSVVWVSQFITPKLGQAKITQYLKSFDYGNADFSGDKNKNNGLTQAWLDSSLEISPVEQIKFLGKLVSNKLDISKQAMANTKTNLYLETSPNNWKLYGKTGSGYYFDKQNNRHSQGWFVGWIAQQNQVYLIALHNQDLQPATPGVYSGAQDQNTAIKILSSEGLF